MNQHHLPTIPDFCRYCDSSHNTMRKGFSLNSVICEDCDTILKKDLKYYCDNLKICFNREAEYIQKDIESSRKIKRHDIDCHIATLELKIASIKYGISLIEWYDEYSDIK